MHSATIVRYLSNGDVSLALETRGSGPSRIVFVHGWSGSRRMFYDVASHLDPNVFTLDLLDMRGSGLSDRPALGHDLIGYANDLRASIEQAGSPLTLVAHCSGATVAQFVAIDPPENLVRMILIAPELVNASTFDVSLRELRTNAFGSRTAIARMVRSLTYRDVSPETFERVIDDAVVTQREAWFARVGDDAGSTLTRRSHAIAIPTSVACGSDDPITTPAAIRRALMHTIPNATYTTLKDSGHNLPIELPRQIAELIATQSEAANVGKPRRFSIASPDARRSG